MKLLVEFNDKKNIDMTYCDGVILSLENYSVTGKDTYSLEEICDITNKYQGKEIFVSLNKNFFNKDLEGLREVLLRLDKMNIKGIFFYDIAVLQLKRELNLKVDLVWSQTHMVNNYKTCDYYFEKGVKYALLGKELTLEEIIEIIKKSSIISMVEVVSRASIAFSKRKLLTNFYHDLGKDPQKELIIHEKVSNENYIVKEKKDGTAFYKEKLTNGTSIIKDLFDIGCSYIIMREDLEEFNILLKDTYKYIENNCQDESFILKYKKLGDYTNFFFKKTIYKVKKNG